MNVDVFFQNLICLTKTAIDRNDFSKTLCQIYSRFSNQSPLHYKFVRKSQARRIPVLFERHLNLDVIEFLFLVGLGRNQQAGSLYLSFANITKAPKEDAKKRRCE